MSEESKKVSIIVSRGSVEGVYPGLIMANGARMEGMEANLFFTFFGLDIINKDHVAHIKVSTVGEPGMHLPTMIGSLPGMSALVTRQLQKTMAELDIPPIPEFLELVSDSGCGLYACQASVDMFKLGKENFIDQVNDIITVGEFYEMADGGHIIFT